MSKVTSSMETVRINDLVRIADMAWAIRAGVHQHIARIGTVKRIGLDIAPSPRDGVHAHVHLDTIRQAPAPAWQRRDDYSASLPQPRTLICAPVSALELLVRP